MIFMLALAALVLRGPSVMFLTGPEITMLKPEVTSDKINTSNYQTLGRSDTNNFKYLQNCPTLASLHSNLCYVSFAHISTQAPGGFGAVTHVSIQKNSRLRHRNSIMKQAD